MEVMPKVGTTTDLSCPMTSVMYSVTQNWMPVTTKKRAVSVQTHAI